MKNLIIFILLSNILFANDLEIKKIFAKNHLQGTLILSSLDKKEYVYNENRAKQRFIPASTFKIPHTLIALKEKVITSNSIIKWDNKKRFYEPWNKNQTIKSALNYSCVWCYQNFAQKISNDTYLNYLDIMNYGNKQTGKDKTTFWLDGDLKISAYEQIAFLKKLYNYQLPFDKKDIDFLKSILINEENDNYILSGKTGWSGSLAWYVGYIKTTNNIWFFALNLDIKEMNKLKLKETI